VDDLHAVVDELAGVVQGQQRSIARLNARVRTRGTPS
jgi:hypothetical protein